MEARNSVFFFSLKVFLQLTVLQIDEYSQIFPSFSLGIYSATWVITISTTFDWHGNFNSLTAVAIFNSIKNIKWTMQDPV